MKLIDNARQYPRFWSVRLGVLAAAFVTLAEVAPQVLHSTWVLLPEAVQDSLPDDFLRYVGIALIIGSLLARVIKQERLR